MNSEPLRRCFRDPVPAIEMARVALERAVDAHLAGDPETAAAAIAEADHPDVREWVDSIWGATSPYVIVREVPGAPPHLPKPERIPVRMPNAAEKAELHKRDGYHCRFCGAPVIRVEIRNLLKRAYPEALKWGVRNVDQHAAFQAMWLQYDHVLPHARGGGNGNDNVVITCAPCNYGRMDRTLEEVGLLDPRDFDPVHSDWDGLERLVAQKESK